MYGQENLDCGNESNVAPSEFLNAFTPIENSATLASGFHFQIPINAVFLTADGNDDDLGEWITQLQIDIQNTNSFFTDNYSFYLCSYDVVEASTDLLHFDSTPSEWQAAYQLSHREDAINVYFAPIVIANNVPAGAVAQYPWTNTSPNNAIVYRYNQLDVRSLLAHELGHYLGLLHTFNNTPYDPALPCESNGDLICDTPADPGTQICTNTCANISCTHIIVTPPNFPDLEWEFTPDRTNLMSYYSCYGKNFTTEQLQVMSVFLFNSGNRNFLIRDDQNFPVNCTAFLVPEGFIVHPVILPDGAEQYNPVNFTAMTFYEQGQSNYFCDPHTGVTEIFSVSTCNLLPTTGDISYSVKRDFSINDWFAPDGNYGNRNGVTTFDVIKITKHILGVQPFTSPFQYIAADVNNSGTVTTLDLIKIRKLILGLTTEFANVESWRFMPAIAEADEQFWEDFNDNPLMNANWLAPDGSSRGYLAENGQKSYLDFVDMNTASSLGQDERVWSFYAIKSGDVNGSATTTVDGFIEDGTVLFTETKRSTELISSGINTSEVLLASISVGENESFDLEGYQFSVNFDDNYLELISIEPGDIAFSSEDFVIDYQGVGATIKTLWNDFKAEGVPVTDQDKLFTLVFHPKSNLTSMSGLVSFGDNGNFQDLVIANNNKLDMTSLMVSYEKADVKDFVIKEAYGNPFTAEGNLHIQLDLKEQKDVSILLQDEFGHSIILNYNDLMMGENNIEISSSTVSYLQAGKIYYTIATDQDVQTGALIKM